MMLRMGMVRRGVMGEAEDEGRARDDMMTFAAFTHIVERHERELFVFLRGLVTEAEHARDLLQDTFYDAWRAATRGAPAFVVDGAPDDIRRWLFHTGYCRAVSALRRRKVIRWESLDRPDAPALDSITSLASFEDQVAEHEALSVALKDLSAEDVATLLLIVVQGFTAPEAAQIMDATPQAVAKRVARAKRRLLAAYLARETQPEGGAPQ
jgi:RNA polymerase sigma-70 factor, ECF subfamily